MKNVKRMFLLVMGICFGIMFVCDATPSAFMRWVACIHIIISTICGVWDMYLEDEKDELRRDLGLWPYNEHR